MFSKFSKYLLFALVAILIASCSDNSNSPISNPDQDAYNAANGVKGAQIYDHVLNYIGADQKNYPNAYTNFFRCKSCHGWDLQGQKGVLIGKTPTATYPTASAINLYDWAHSHTIREVFDAIKNTGGRVFSDTYDSKHPDYGKILTDAQIWDAVKFLKVNAHNYLDFYDITTTGSYPTGTITFSNIGKAGNAAAGLVTYKAKCEVCHGSDGKKIDVYCQGLFMGEMFRKDPHEMQHKAIWGMPMDREHVDGGCKFANYMPILDISDQDIRNMMVMGKDTVMFPGK
ncbi:MAG: c-type cytochrome [Candidatus Kapabacteria bacterium]|nr:c-type cytochrome [Candidatus Kapabacteria bacterium]